MKRLILSLFILVPALIAASVALPNAAISELENRNLTTKSDISFNVKDGTFQNDIESLLSDQFPFREGLVKAQTGIRYIIGQRDIGGAYICKDGRLIQKITDADIDKSALISYADKINLIAEKSRVYVMYVPSAETVLKNELPKGAPIYDYGALQNELEAHLTNAKIIDLRIALSDIQCYYKTDHHWTVLGAYGAYSAFCNAKGESAKPMESFELSTVSSDFQGTLFSKVPIVKTKDEIKLPKVPKLNVAADGAEIDFYDMSALSSKDKYNVFQGGNHGIVEIENPNAKSDKTLLILKDSFANSFVPFIAEDYSKIIMLDERYGFISTQEYADSLNPDEILVLREIIN